MTHLSRFLNTEEGRAALATYAEDSVRMRIRKRWERRRELSRPPAIGIVSDYGAPRQMGMMEIKHIFIPALEGDRASDTEKERRSLLLFW